MVAIIIILLDLLSLAFLYEVLGEWQLATGMVVCQ